MRAAIESPSASPSSAAVRPRLGSGIVPLFVAALPVCLAGCGGLTRNDSAEGVKLYQQGNYLGAVNHFQEALARQPGDPDCFYNLGATYHQQAKLFGQSEARTTAEQYYHLCLARQPGHEPCRRALAVLLVEEGREEEAMASLREWARVQPGSPAPYVELARLCEERGDLREAENQLVDALGIAPNDPRALVALAHIRERTGNTGQALANYQRALAADPAQPVVAARVAALATALPAGTAPGASPPATPAAAAAATAAAWTSASPAR